MKYIVLVAGLLLLFSGASIGQDSFVNNNVRKTPKPYGVDKEWRTCSYNSDCVAALRGCWTWEPINKKFMNDFLERNPPNCPRATQPGLQPAVVCEMMACKATDKTTGVTGNDWLQSYWGPIK